jgi:hypothetical protein
MSAEHGLYVPPDSNITHYSTGHHVQSVTVNEKFLMVEDPMLGDFVIKGEKEDRVYYDYLTTPNMFRAGGISQLCKDRTSATIPNTASFNRKWHILGLFNLVDTFSDRVQATPDERLAYHLGADGDDQAHMIWSHATEQAIQLWGGPENYHEQIWPTVAKLGGTLDVLQKHGIKVDRNVKVPGVEMPGWLNSNHPDINLDRFQYAVTELLLWFDHDGSTQEVRDFVRQICSPDNLAPTPDGQLAFKDVETARIFAKGYLLLATEHWNDPINRVQLHLLIHATQRAITKRRISWMDEVDKGETRRPENYLFGVDQDVIDAMDTGPGQSDDFIYAIRNTLHPIAMQERQRYIDYKMNEYAAFLMDEKAKDYPSEHLSPKRVEFGPPSSQVSVDIVRGKQAASSAETPLGPKIPILNSNAEGISYELSPLKNRYVDPLILVGDHVKRLSEVDPNYRSLLSQQQKIQKMRIVVKLAFAGGFEEAFKKGIKLNDREFGKIRRRSPMTADQQRRVIEMAAQRAKKMDMSLGSLVVKSAL